MTFRDCKLEIVEFKLWVGLKRLFKLCAPNRRYDRIPNVHDLPPCYCYRNREVIVYWKVLYPVVIENPIINWPAINLSAIRERAELSVSARCTIYWLTILKWWIRSWCVFMLKIAGRWASCWSSSSTIKLSTSLSPFDSFSSSLEDSDVSSSFSSLSLRAPGITSSLLLSFSDLLPVRVCFLPLYIY